MTDKLVPPKMAKPFGMNDAGQYFIEAAKAAEIISMVKPAKPSLLGRLRKWWNGPQPEPCKCKEPAPWVLNGRHCGRCLREISPEYRERQVIVEKLQAEIETCKLRMIGASDPDRLYQTGKIDGLKKAQLILRGQDFK